MREQRLLGHRPGPRPVQTRAVEPPWSSLRPQMSRIAASLAAVLASLSFAACGDDGAEPDAPSGGAATPAAGLELILDFQPNAVHTGIYAAQGQDLFAEAGIELTIREPGASTDAPKLLRSGRADLAILDIHDLALARESGIDLVGIAAIVQRPLAAVIAADRHAVGSPADLAGERIGVTGLPSDDAVLESVLDSAGLGARRRAPGDDRLRLGGGAGRRRARRRDRVLERRGRCAQRARRADPRVPRRRLRRARLPGAGAGHDAGEAGLRTRDARRRRRCDRRRIRVRHQPIPRRRSISCSPPCPASIEAPSGVSSRRCSTPSAARGRSTRRCSTAGPSGTSSTGSSKPFPTSASLRPRARPRRRLAGLRRCRRRRRSRLMPP